MVSCRSIFVRVAAVFVLLSLVAPLSAQSTTATKKRAQPAAADELGFPDTPAGRMKHFGLSEDPGLNPDPDKVWIRQGQGWTIAKFERKWAKYDDPRPGYVRPFGFANFAYEIYRQDPESVWVWVLAPSALPEPAPETSEQPDVEPDQSAELVAEKARKFVRGIRPEFEPLEPPRSAVSLAFKESSTGLPSAGSWRNTLALADMNGDGNLDIVAPPQRGIGGTPSIFLGDGKGKWAMWKEARFPAAFNYGSVAAADVNRDGAMDLVFGVHLTGIRAFLGDGKGHFEESSKGLPNKGYPTRRTILADVNSDGYPDIVSLNEGPILSQDPKQERPDARLKAFLNDGKGSAWKEVVIAGNDKFVGGDWLSTGDFNGDRLPDFIASSIYFNGTDILYLSDKTSGKVPAWKTAGSETFIPYFAYYWANAAGKFTNAKRDDALIAFQRTWPETVQVDGVDAPKDRSFAGVDLIRFDGKTPRRVPVLRWAGVTPIWGMATGDFDGDGNLDFVFSRLAPERKLDILLGDGKGGFSRADTSGLNIKPNRSYDLNVADVNHDGIADIIINYEAAGVLATSPKDGAIQVFLGEGKRPATAG